MKKRKLFGNVIAGFLALALVMQVVPMLTVQAGDTWPYKGEAAHGENEPSVHGYTSQQIADWDYESDPDAELLRSRVPLQDRVAALAATQANPNLDPNVKMINVAGDYGNAFIENAPYTNKFAQYHFSFWQYIDMYSYWHGTASAYTPTEYYGEVAQADWQQKWFEFGILNIPNPAYTDAAHKNGVMSLAGIFFSDNDRGQQTYKQMIVQDADGNFPVAEKLADMAEYFGYDGYFINQEELSPNVATADIPAYKKFLAVLQDRGIYVQWYNSLNTSSGANTFEKVFGANAIGMLFDTATGKKLTDSFFFDYSTTASNVSNAKNNLNNLNNNNANANFVFLDTAFQGYEAGSDRWKNGAASGRTNLAPILSNGVPQISIATLGADFVHAALDDEMNKSYPIDNRHDNNYQWMTTVREQLWWSGPNFNPQNTTKSSSNTVSDVYADNRNWPGMASLITERSVISGANFYSYFNTGHGMNYYSKGVVNNSSEWSNLSMQDIPVTWQWWQDTTGNRLTVDHDYGTEYKLDGTRYDYTQLGGYEGGSSLVAHGDLSADVFLRLFKTELAINENHKLDLVFNRVSLDDDSTLSVGLIFEDAPTTVVYVPVTAFGDVDASGWETATLDLSAYADRTLVVIGVNFGAGEATIDDFQVNIGGIRVYDNSAVVPSAPTGLSIRNAFANTDEAYIEWNLDEVAHSFDKVKQFNIYVNNVFVGAKYDEIFYVKNMPAKSGTIKVVPVGADGLEGTAATLSFNLLSGGISNLQAVSTDNGELAVSWTADNAPGDVVVNVKSVNWLMGEPVNATLTATGGASSVVFTNMPICGDDYIITAGVDGCDPISLSGNFIDVVVDPYAEAWSWSGNTLKLPMPTTRDWRYMYFYENGTAKTFATTYSQGNKPMIIRGRSTKASLSVSSSAKNVWVVIEDYAGNLSAPLYLRSDSVTASVFPDPVFLQWVIDNIGPMMPNVDTYAGALDLSGVAIEDYTGIERFVLAQSLDLSGNGPSSFDVSRLPASIKTVDLSDNENLTEVSMKNLAADVDVDLSGCSNLSKIVLTGTKHTSFDLTEFTKLTHFYGDDSALATLTTAGAAAYEAVEVFDISGSCFDLTDGTPEQALVAAFADASVFGDQHPVAYLEDLVDQVDLLIDGTTVRTMDYFEDQYLNAVTVRGTLISEILEADWIAANYDLAKQVAIPEKVYVEIYDSEGTMMNPPDEENTVPTVDTENLGLEATVLSYSAQLTSEPASKMFDGTTANNSKWCANGQSGWVAFSLPESVTLGQWIAHHAEAGGELASYNTKDFVLQVFNTEAAGMSEADIIAAKTKTVLQNNANWTTISTVSNNTLGVTSIELDDAPEAQVYRIQISASIQGTSNAAIRVYELELFAMNNVARDTDGFFTADTKGEYTVNYMKGKNTLGTTVLNVADASLQEITLNKSEYTILKNKTATFSIVSQIPAITTTDMSNPVWTSSDPSVVMMTEARPGQIKALKAGTATITCTIGDVSASVVVTVTTLEVSSFALDTDVLKIGVNDTYAFQFVDVLPVGATNLSSAKWFSSNGNVVKVAADGTLEAVAVGYSTVTCQIGSVKMYCKVYVK